MNDAHFTPPGTERKAAPADGGNHADFIGGRLLTSTMSVLAHIHPEWLAELPPEKRDEISRWRAAQPKREAAARHVRSDPRPPDARIHALDWAALASQKPPARQWYVQHWLAPGATLLAGRGGAGKSLLAQELGTALAVGVPFIDDIPQPHTVLTWACEDSDDELWRRQISICSHFNISMDTLAGKLLILPRRGQENCLYATAYGRPAWTPEIADLEEQIADYKADVVVLDNLAQLFGANENDRHHVTEFINGLLGIAHDRPVAFLLLAHPSRNHGSEFSGSSAWENCVRMRWYLGDRLPDEKDDGDDGPAADIRFLCKRKANYTALDYRRFTFDHGVLVPDKVDVPAGDGLTAHLRNERAKHVVLAAIQRLAELGIHTSEKNTARNSAPSVITQYKLNEDLSRRELGDAMRELLLDGKLTREVVGRYPNRTEMYGLRAASWLHKGCTTHL